MLKTLIAFAVAFVGVSFAIVCPVDICARIRCDGSPIYNCQNGRVDMRGGYCGCCPICIRQIPEGDYCIHEFLEGQPKTSECAKGLVCDRETMTCKKASSQNPCATELAQKKKLLEQYGGRLDGLTLPVCNEDGFYAPRQCIESLCRCVSRNGKPIEGYEAHVSKAAAMSCECARRNSDQILLGMNCIPHKCDELGNFIKPPVGAC